MDKTEAKNEHGTNKHKQTRSKAWTKHKQRVNTALKSGIKACTKQKQRMKTALNISNQAWTKQKQRMKTALQKQSMDKAAAKSEHGINKQKQSMKKAEPVQNQTKGGSSSLVTGIGSPSPGRTFSAEVNLRRGLSLLFSSCARLGWTHCQPLKEELFQRPEPLPEFLGLKPFWVWTM